MRCSIFNNIALKTERTRCLPQRKLSVPGSTHFKRTFWHKMFLKPRQILVRLQAVIQQWDIINPLKQSPLHPLSISLYTVKRLGLGLFRWGFFPNTQLIRRSNFQFRASGVIAEPSNETLLSSQNPANTLCPWFAIPAPCAFCKPYTNRSMEETEYKNTYTAESRQKPGE